MTSTEKIDGILQDKIDKEKSCQLEIEIENPTIKA